MSFYDDASLIMYPSGYKEDKIYSLKPTNGTGDLTFSRASSATRVNSEGLIETATIIGSELVTNGDFATDSDWSKGAGWSISGGSLNATATAGPSVYVTPTVNFLTAGKAYLVTYSVVSISSGSVNVQLGSQAGTGRTAVGTYSEIITATGVAFYIYTPTNPSTLSIDNLSVKEVITSNVPRIDYSNGCGSLLLEPQSTNLALHNISFSGWNISASTITANYGISPDGTTNATRILRTGSARSVVYRNVSVTNGQTYTVSLYVKSLSGTQNVRIGADNGCVNPQGAETFAVGEEWTRIETSITSTQSSWNIFIDNVESGIGCTGTYGALDILAYGFQCELGSYATSLINTTSTSVTRVADAASKTGISSLINSTEGVLYAEIANISEDNNVTVSISINDGSVSNAVSLYYFSTGGVYYDVFNSAGTRSGNTSMTKLQQAQKNKIALKYKSGDIALWVNGIEADTNSGTLSLSGLNQVNFHYGDGSVPFYGNVQNLMVFPSALTDDELSDLTGAVHQTFNSLATFYNYTIL
mgnify:CR=1 FL=1